MAKETKTQKAEKTAKGKKVELKDLRAKKDPKGGALLYRRRVS